MDFALRREEPAGAKDVRSGGKSCAGAEADGDRQYSSGTADGGSLPEIEPGRNRVPEKSLDLISLIVYRDLTVFAGDPIMSFASGFVSEYFS